MKRHRAGANPARKKKKPEGQRGRAKGRDSGGSRGERVTGVRLPPVGRRRLSAEGPSRPQQALAMSGDISRCHTWELATGIQWIEGRDAAEHPPRCRPAPEPGIFWHTCQQRSGENPDVELGKPLEGCWLSITLGKPQFMYPKDPKLYRT